MTEHKEAKEIVCTPSVESIQGTPQAAIQAPPQLHPLLVAAMAKGDVNVETLERMQEIQFRHEANEARKAYTQAKVALMASIPPIIAHDRNVDYPSKKGLRVKYSYATMAAAVKEIQPKLSKFGFSYQWFPENLDNGHIKITFRLTHTAGHFEDFPMSGPPDTAGGKDPLKALGSTKSYLRRYTFCDGFGIVTADMKDADDHSADDAASHVDHRKNAEAIAYIESKGLPLEEAERHIGRVSMEWTVNDLSKLREFIRDRGLNKPNKKILQERVVIESHKLWGDKWKGELDVLFRDESDTTFENANTEALQWALCEITDRISMIEDEKNGVNNDE